jgi:hypothetical protein
MKVISHVLILSVPEEGYYSHMLILRVPDEGYSSHVLTLSVPDEGYSRNSSCALILISTILFIPKFTDQLTPNTLTQNKLQNSNSSTL